MKNRAVVVLTKVVHIEYSKMLSHKFKKIAVVVSGRGQREVEGFASEGVGRGSRLLL